MICTRWTAPLQLIKFFCKALPVPDTNFAFLNLFLSVPTQHFRKMRADVLYIAQLSVRQSMRSSFGNEGRPNYQAPRRQNIG